jgi:hypothetical protein
MWGFGSANVRRSIGHGIALEHGWLHCAYRPRDETDRSFGSASYGAGIALPGDDLRHCGQW